MLLLQGLISNKNKSITDFNYGAGKIGQLNAMFWYSFFPPQERWDKKGEIILDAVERSLKNSAIIRDSQHRFTKVKSCLTNMISFNIFINDQDARVESTVSQPAAETNLGGAVDPLEEQEAFKRDLDRLIRWVIVTGMKFNNSRCWILHLGQNNTRHKYNLGERCLQDWKACGDITG